MKLNTPTKPIRTHEGAVAQHINSELALRRSVMSCLLWEDEFYESGETIAKRIAELIPKVRPEVVSAIAVEARTKMKLRHVPLKIVREMARIASHKPFVAETLEQVIQRADELTEFCAIWQKDQGKKPLSKTLSAQAKKGLAKAFTKFNEYALAKYNRDGAIKLRDVLFLSHAKAKDEEQDALWKRLINGELKTPDTWEVELSASKDKLGSWTRLLAENKLGALALLRNLRNMQQVGVPMAEIRRSLNEMKTERVLPFRFIAAARHAPQLEPELEQAMFRALSEMDKIDGPTAILIDHSGSMQQTVSTKSEISRFDAAAAVAMILREKCSDVRIFTFSDICVEVPPRRGFALRDAICSMVRPQWTLLGAAVQHVYTKFPACQRLIVITDEQSADQPSSPHGTGYVINVASARNGVGYGAWTHIDGWSEAVLDYILQLEKSNG
jgi:60 kDa SS-A/Ro ribonucleoprotein